ncbi:hypothetical protein BGW38_008750, partial [Lunasporangiospora selenospora]
PKAGAASSSSTVAAPAPVAATAAPTTSAPAAAPTAPVVGVNATPAASTEPTAPTSSDNSLVTGAQFETAIQGMMEMGFAREECMKAMRASFNNPDRAVEYLMTGIPEHLQAQTSAPAPAPTRAPSAPSAPAATSPTSAPSAQPQNLFTAAAQAAASAQQDTATTGSIENLAFLRDQPQFQQIRGLVQQNPQLLQPLLQQLGLSNPQMLQLINQNQQAFLDLLNEGAEDDANAPTSIYLENLGFDTQTALEAFLLCDRDEQLAANYLFDHMHDEADEDHQ